MWEPKYYSEYPLPTTSEEARKLTFKDLIDKSRTDALVRDSLWLPQSKPLFPFQRTEILAMDEAMVTWLQSCRGTAKSYIDARFALPAALTFPLKVVCTGPTFRQALHPFNYIDVLMRENWDEELPLSISREQEGQTVRGSMEAVIRFKNGSVIKALPMGNGEKLRGERADILICDEFFLMEREMFQSHILPFLLGHREPGQVKKLIMSTSAEYEDSFAYSVLTKRILPKIIAEDAKCAIDPDYQRVYTVLDFNVDDVRAEGFNLDQDILDLLLDGANEEERQQALYNKWKGTSGQFFPANLSEKMQSPQVKIEHSRDGTHEYGFTVDVARTPQGDLFVIEVYKFVPEDGNKMDFVNCYFNKGLSASEMAWKIYEYDERFNPTLIVMDKGGGGMFVRDELMKTVLEFQDGSKKEIKPKDFILEHNENRSIPGRKKLIFNRYGDDLVRQAFADDRSRGGEYIQNEDIMSHLLYDGLRQTLAIHDIPIRIPNTYTDEGDTDNAESVIYDRIKTSIQQLRLLKMVTDTDEDGNKFVVKSKVNNVPKYAWKNAQKDGAVAFCYSYILYRLMYRDEVGRHERTLPMVTATVPNEGFEQFDGMVEYHPGQLTQHG